MKALILALLAILVLTGVAVYTIATPEPERLIRDQYGRLWHAGGELPTQHRRSYGPVEVIGTRCVAEEDDPSRHGYVRYRWVPCYEEPPTPMLADGPPTGNP